MLVVTMGASDRTCPAQVRAFAGWPGTTAELEILGKDASQGVPESIKILSTRVVSADARKQGEKSPPRVEVRGKGLVVHCGSEGGEGGCLEVLAVQPVGRKAMPVSAFLNGLSGRSLRLAKS